MWSVGRAETPQDTSRLVQMSQPELSRQVGITERNLRIAIIRLIEKLAVEEVAGYTKDTKAPRVYRVFSEDEILRRRRDAGLVWVVRRKGVQFVSPGEASPRPVYTTPIVLTPTVSTGVVIQHQEDFASLISSAFRHEGIPVTPAVSGRLWLECRRRNPDCTPEEVAELVKNALADLRPRVPADQIVVQLLREWPELVDPERVTHFREAFRRSRERLREIDAESRRYWESVAADATADEAERRLARRILGGL